jgi:hypothetical protein
MDVAVCKYSERVCLCCGLRWPRWMHGTFRDRVLCDLCPAAALLGAHATPCYTRPARAAQFDPVVRQHVLFTEQKLSRTKKKKG